MSEKTYFQRNRDVVLNRAKDYYENDKKTLREQFYLKKKKKKKERIWKKQISWYAWRKETKTKRQLTVDKCLLFCFITYYLLKSV